MSRIPQTYLDLSLEIGVLRQVYVPHARVKRRWQATTSSRDVSAILMQQWIELGIFKSGDGFIRDIKAEHLAFVVYKNIASFANQAFSVDRSEINV